MVIKTFSDGTQMLNTNRCEQYPISYADGSVDTPAETWENAVRDGIEYCLEKLI